MATITLKDIVDAITGVYNSTPNKIALGSTVATLQNEAAAVGNGVVIDLENTNAITFVVTGTFDATVVIQASLDGVNYRDWKVRSIDTGISSASIINPGVYVCETYGLKKIRARVNAYTSGAVTVVAVATTAPFTHNSKKRNVEIARISNVTVEAGATTRVIRSIDVSEFPIQYVTTRNDSSHHFAIEFWYETKPPALTLGSPAGNITIIDTTALRAYSEWFEARSEILNVFVKNQDAVAHAYDVVVYGVR